jgi:DNA polymerase-3 subunit gamma/tau
MKDYIVSARKYRPMTFDSVVGQNALTTTLKNAVKSGKIANTYLFCGPRGVGKTTCARIFAKAINCQNHTADGEACNECESCKAFNEQRSFNIFELDAASNNSVDGIRELIKQTLVPPQVGRYKVFIIDEVHMLSQSAFNAFLKTLEEPPAYVIFILATTEKNKILPTILSRCQIYDFERMTVPNIINHLKMVAQKEGFTCDDDAYDVIAEKADGGMRDALSIFDQVASYCQGHITYAKTIEDLNVLDADNYFQVTDLALQNKVSDIMVLLNSLLSKGFDGGNFVNGLASHLRNVLMAKDEQTLPLLEVSQKQRDRFKEQATKCPVDFIYKALKILNNCDINYSKSTNRRLLVELTLIEVAQITQPDDDTPAAGQCPKRLKSLFKYLVVNVKPISAVQVAEADKPILGTTRAAQHRETTAVPVEETPKKSVEKPKVKLGSISMSFDNLIKGPKKPDYIKEPEIENKDENNDFSQEELELKWIEMCNRMPQKYVALASRLKNIRPQLTQFPKVELVVENQILLDQILEIKRRINSTLAKDLHNGNISLDIRLAKAEEVGKVLTKMELFDNMRKDNPAIEKLRNNLNLIFS